MARAGRWSTATLAALAMAACGGGGKGATEPDEVAEGDEDEPEADESPSDEIVDPAKLDELQRCFVRKRKSVARCYSAAVESGQLDKKARGRITVTMVITAGGRAKDLTISQDTLKSEVVATCVKDTINSWEIPGPGVDTEFSFTYDFEPE